MHNVLVHLVRIPSTHRSHTPVITVTLEAEPLPVNPMDNGQPQYSARVSYNLRCGFPSLSSVYPLHVNAKIICRYTWGSTLQNTK